MDASRADRYRQVEVGNAALALLKETPDEDLEAALTARLGEALYNVDRFAEALVHLERGSDLSRKLGEENLLLQCLGNIALTAHLMGDSERTLRVGQECLALAEKLDQPSSIWRIGSILGAEHGRLGEYEEALGYYSMSLGVATAIGDGDGTSSLLNNICVIHTQYGKYDEALEFIEMSRDVLDSLEDPIGKATVLVNRGSLFLAMEDPDNALGCFREALRLEEELGSESGIAVCHRHIGRLHLETGEFELALEHLGRALELEEKLELHPEIATTLGLMAETYAALDRGEEALDAVEQGRDLAEALDIKMERLGISWSLSKTREVLGDFEGALAAYKEASRLASEKKGLEYQDAFAKFEAEFDLGRKEQELEILRRKNELRALEVEHQRLARNSTIVGALLVAVVALLGWNRFLVKRRALSELGQTHEQLRGANTELVTRTAELEGALAEIHVLKGLLPICAHCKSIRDESGGWHVLEEFLSGHTQLSFSHGICPECLEMHYSRGVTQ